MRILGSARWTTLLTVSYDSLFALEIYDGLYAVRGDTP